MKGRKLMLKFFCVISLNTIPSRVLHNLSVNSILEISVVLDMKPMGDVFLQDMLTTCIPGGWILSSEPSFQPTVLYYFFF